MPVMAFPDWTIPRRSQQDGLRLRRRLGLTRCNQGLLGASSYLPWLWVAADMAAIGLHVPGRAVVVLVDAQDRVQLRLPYRIADRCGDLHASRQIAVHLVRRADSDGDGPSLSKLTVSGSFSRSRLVDAKRHEENAGTACKSLIKIPKISTSHQAPAIHAPALEDHPQS